MKNNCTYNRLYSYRSVWMGIAILWIMYFHLPHDFITNPLLLKLQLYGYGGVDIFLFASGIGCFYSLGKRNTEFSNLDFFKRRLLRILPAYWTFMVFWIALEIPRLHIGIQSIIGNLLGIQAFVPQGISFNWYIGLIFVLYLLAPIMYELCKRTDSLPRALLLTGLVILFTVPWIGDQGMLIYITRFPIFFVGMLFGKLGLEERSISWKIWLVMIMTLVGVVALWIVDRCFYDYIWISGLAWYVFLPIVPGLCLCISFFGGGNSWNSSVQVGLCGP